MVKTPEAEARLEYVSPDFLDFDPSNPRFAGLMDGRSQDEIQKALFGEPYYASALVDSFVENGFIDYEPLVVKQCGTRYTLVEGNRRLAAIREIQAHPDRYAGRKSDLKSIPVLVFPKKPDKQQQNEMRVYLGVRHLLGFREWPSISKAQFLENESKAAGGLEKVLKETRMTRDKAKRFLVPYRLLSQAGVRLPQGEDFWMLGEALQRTGIKSYLQLQVDPNTLEIKSYDKKHLGLLLDDLYGRRKTGGDRDPATRLVGDTRDLSRLAKVLSTEKATVALRAGKPLEEAEIYVDSREESVVRLSKVTKQLGVLLKKLCTGIKDPEASHLAQAYKDFDTAVKAFVGKGPK
jgi:hypothetical protein